ncbi:MAG: sugar ABC transporter permease, partial [Lachnospiraceae bacterium]|nr:sugar ABC transporter permease [Lachnospiraceae bacterium]
FYTIPFAVSFYYSMVDNPITKEYCGLGNYMELFQNPYFMKGLKNTALFMAVSIPLNILLSLCIALGLRGMKQHSGMFNLFFFNPVGNPLCYGCLFLAEFFRAAWDIE